MTQFSFEWISSLNWLSQFWGPLQNDEVSFISRAEGPSLRLGLLDLGSKLFPTNLWDDDRVETYVDHPESDRRLELVWVPTSLPQDLLSTLIAEIESKLKEVGMTESSISTGIDRVDDLRETHKRLTEEGSNAYPRLAGTPRILPDDHHLVLQVPIGPSKYGVALIRERHLNLATAIELASRHILNSLAVRVAYVYEDSTRQKWIEFQQRQSRENATYGGAWDVSAAGYLDPQRHEDPTFAGRISAWQACASELAEELRIPLAELPHRDNYYFFGIGRNDPTGQLDLLAYCFGSYIPNPSRAASPLVL